MHTFYLKSFIMDIRGIRESVYKNANSDPFGTKKVPFANILL
jgi:hypothetical protein